MMGVSTWILVVVVVALLYVYGKWRHRYWSTRGVVTPPVVPIIGHMYSFFTDRTKFFSKFYGKFRDHKVFGLYEFFSPTLMVVDPDLLKMILVKDFDHFVDRRPFGVQKDSVMGEMLSNKVGDEWKDLRAVMSPTFSSGKMRGMFHLITANADRLVSFSLQKAVGNKKVDMKDMFGRFTMDTIASCAFGIECNSLSDHKPIFVEKADIFFQFRGVRLLKILFMVSFPKLFDLLGFKVDTPEVEFFKRLSKENMEARKTGQKRGDFLDLLLEAEANQNDWQQGKRVFGKNTLVAQSVLFLVAGYDTTASALAFTSFLLAKHRRHQDTLRRELQQLVDEHGSITYTGIMEAKFLDACLMEVLRIYPPGLIGERMCTNEYRVPDTDIVLYPGQVVQFPIWSIHHDAVHWPQPEEFRPERFLPENRGEIKSFTHIPFGMGPRNCIAMRFALMEAKVALAHLILAADLEVAPGHEEVKVEKSPFTLRPSEGVMLLLTPRKKE